jgi:PII-like signaling protein
MNGYQITFFTQQDRQHHGQPMAQWLMRLAADMGLRGATLIAASEGMGHDRRMHAARFFELADQPLTVLMTLTEAETERLFARLESEGANLFYTRVAVEFGSIGQPHQAG